MISLKRLTHIMERPEIYRLWQAPFAEAKLRPLCRHNDLALAGRVLDVGCGPGTNTRHFHHSVYCGLDINPRYVEYARRKYGCEYIAADACEYSPPHNLQYDFILLNSLLHHLDEPGTCRLLRRLHDLLAPDGHIHILELVLPKEPSVARYLARCDRGDFPRQLADWERIFHDIFSGVLFEPFPVSACGVTLWNMVYFKGKRRS